MRVLITGESGFIAGHLGRELQDAGHLVAGIDIADGGLGGLRLAIEDHKAEVLIHLEDVDCDLPESHLFNTVGSTAGVTAEVASMCGELGVRLVYASTDEIYGDIGDAVPSEEGPFALPSTTYALGKLMGESLGLLYAPKGLTVLRISSPYGPGGKSPVVDLLFQALHGLPMTIRTQERSWCWIGDIVRGIRLAMEKGRGVYNIGRDDDATLMEVVAELACTMTGADKGLIKKVEEPTNEPLFRRISAQKLRNLGWEPRVSLYQGMEMTLDGWVKQMDSPPQLVSQ